MEPQKNVVLKTFEDVDSYFKKGCFHHGLTMRHQNFIVDRSVMDCFYHRLSHCTIGDIIRIKNCTFPIQSCFWKALLINKYVKYMWITNVRFVDNEHETLLGGCSLDDTRIIRLEVENTLLNIWSLRFLERWSMRTHIRHLGLSNVIDDPIHLYGFLRSVARPSNKVTYFRLENMPFKTLQDFENIATMVRQLTHVQSFIFKGHGLASLPGAMKILAWMVEDMPDVRAISVTDFAADQAVDLAKTVLTRPKLNLLNLGAKGWSRATNIEFLWPFIDVHNNHHMYLTFRSADNPTLVRWFYNMDYFETKFFRIIFALCSVRHVPRLGSRAAVKCLSVDLLRYVAKTLH